MSSVATLEPVTQSPSAYREDEWFYEIINGQRVEIPPLSAYASKIATRLVLKLGTYSVANDLGEAVMETLFRLNLPVDRNRRPDIAFVSYQRWPKGQPMGDANAWDVVPNLAIEVISPHDLVEELDDKLEEYFRSGVELVWMFLPRRGKVYVYESATKVRVLALSDTLDGGSVVPGFKLTLSELFPELGSGGPQI